MPFCGKCGTQVNEGVKFCPSCGTPIGGAQRTATEAPPPPNQNQAGGAQGFADNVKNLNNTPDYSGEYDAQDIANNKVMAVLAYLGLLVLIPIFAAKNSKYARFHANQGLTLFIVDVGWSIVNSILNSILFNAMWYSAYGAYRVITSILGLVWIPILVLVIIGIVNAASGKAKELPVIGKIKLLK